jgi:hypothetical protein
LRWDEEEVIVYKPINIDNNALATEGQHAIHKKYVDDKIAELLARIEELEMSGTPTSYSFSMRTKRYGSNQSIGQYMSRNDICSHDYDGNQWAANYTYALTAERKSIYICFEDGYQLNSTGHMQVIKNNGSTQYGRTDPVATFAISEVEVCPPDKANNKNIYRAKVQVDAFKDDKARSLPAWGDGDGLTLTFTGGSVTKVS